MKWRKQGLIYSPSFEKGWRNNSALTPTPIQLNDSIIRLYAAFRDEGGIGRIGFVDVDSNNPSNLIKISDTPVLDIGQSGMFDDNGVILGDVVRVKNKFYMYYVGFQLVKKVKFLAFSGLAISDLEGENFVRYSETPVLDRNNEGKYIRAIHSVIYEDNKFKIWYAVGNGWENINGVNYPQYDINYTESDDGIHIFSGKKVVQVDKTNSEYRIGRPRVYKTNDQYIMNFTYGTSDGRYMAGQAESKDGLIWKRYDENFGIYLSKEGWDSRHLSYPCVLTTNQGKTFMFYNGNDMGRDGFGYAVLDGLIS